MLPTEDEIANCRRAHELRRREAPLRAKVLKNRCQKEIDAANNVIRLREAAGHHYGHVYWNAIERREVAVHCLGHIETIIADFQKFERGMTLEEGPTIEAIDRGGLEQDRQIIIRSNIDIAPYRGRTADPVLRVCSEIVIEGGKKFVRVFWDDVQSARQIGDIRRRVTANLGAITLRLESKSEESRLDTIAQGQRAAEDILNLWAFVYQPWSERMGIEADIVRDVIDGASPWALGAKYQCRDESIFTRFRSACSAYRSTALAYRRGERTRNSAWHRNVERRAMEMAAL